MKQRHHIVRNSLVTTFVAVAVCAFVSQAQTTRKTSVIYIPKTKGQSKQRTDGATRGGPPTAKLAAGEKPAPLPVIRVLTPEDTAVVSADRPVLYWYINQATSLPCDVIVKTQDDEPIFEQHFDGIKSAGLVRVDLSKGKKKLEAGKDYRFAVLLTVASQDPASDIESSGAVQFTPPPPDVAQRLAGGSAIDKATVYAGEGYFTDAVAALAADPSPDAKATLQDLLAQAKLEVKPK